MSKHDQPAAYLLYDNGDVEYNTIDSFSCGRSGGVPLYLHPATAAEAMDVLRKAMREDSSYAWSWQCNVAMAAVDAGATHRQANVHAAQFMRNAFGVDVTASEEWKKLFGTGD